MGWARVTLLLVSRRCTITITIIITIIIIVTIIVIIIIITITNMATMIMKNIFYSCQNMLEDSSGSLVVSIWHISKDG